MTSPDRMATYQQPSATWSAARVGTPLAPFTRRAFALFIDFWVAGIAFLIATVGGGILGQRIGLIAPQEDVRFEFTFFENWYSVVWLVVYFALGIYFGRGQTIGKRLCRIRVVSLVHEQVGFWHALERALGYGASALEAGFGFFQYFLRADRRTVHDRIAETIVVVEPRRMAKKR